jgi:hypothetical protein
VRLDYILGQQFQVVFWCARSYLKNVQKHFVCQTEQLFWTRKKFVQKKQTFWARKKCVRKGNDSFSEHVVQKKENTENVQNCRTDNQEFDSWTSKNRVQKPKTKKPVQKTCTFFLFILHTCSGQKKENNFLAHLLWTEKGKQSFCTHALDRKRETKLLYKCSGQKKGNKAFVHMLWTRKVEHRFWTDVEHRKNCTTFLNTRCRQKKFHTVGLCKLF